MPTLSELLLMPPQPDQSRLRGLLTANQSGMFGLGSLAAPQGALAGQDGDYNKVMQILNSNSGKLFVDRILNRQAYPTLDLGDGMHATHRMAWYADDGKYRVYPTVQYVGGQMVDMGPDKGYDHAMKSNDYIDFKTPEEADWFSQNYKKAWTK